MLHRRVVITELLIQSNNHSEIASITKKKEVYQWFLSLSINDSIVFETYKGEEPHYFPEWAPRPPI